MRRLGGRKAVQILPINPKLCQQELNETAVWLRILMKSIAIKDEIIVDILQETSNSPGSSQYRFVQRGLRSLPAPNGQKMIHDKSLAP